jgi:hypothetical protein
VPRYKVQHYNSVSGNLHGEYEVDAADEGEAKAVAAQRSDDIHKHTDVTRPQFRTAVTCLDPQDTDSEEE